MGVSAEAMLGCSFHVQTAGSSVLDEFFLDGLWLFWLYLDSTPQPEGATSGESCFLFVAASLFFSDFWFDHNVGCRWFCRFDTLISAQVKCREVT